MAKEEYLKRYKEKYPEKDYTDNDDDLFADAHAEYTELNDYKTKNSEVNKKLLSVLTAHPEIRDFIRDIAKGAPVEEALARNFDLKGIEAAEGDPDLEKWGAGLKDREARQSERDAYLKTGQENVDISTKTMQDFMAKNKIEEEQAIEFFEMIDAIVKDAIDGKVEERTLTALYTAVTHDDVVKDEVEKATVKAKNNKIEAEMEKDDTKKTGDGLPPIATGGQSINTSKKDLKPADAFSKSILEREQII